MDEILARKWTKTEAFQKFGVTLTNVRWSWSGRSDDSKTVVLALWNDRFAWKSKPVIYEGFRKVVDEAWLQRPGNRERLENLIWARDRCDGLFRVVMVAAKDRDADPREIDDAYPREDMTMRLIELNDTTGEFRAEWIKGV